MSQQGAGAHRRPHLPSRTDSCSPACDGHLTSLGVAGQSGARSHATVNVLQHLTHSVATGCLPLKRPGPALCAGVWDCLQWDPPLVAAGMACLLGRQRGLAGLHSVGLSDGLDFSLPIVPARHCLESSRGMSSPHWSLGLSIQPVNVGCYDFKMI